MMSHMLRKRTTIKPNLGQAAAKPAIQQLKQPEQPATQPPEAPTRVVSETQPTHNRLSDDELSKRVNEAINQLTGQKFEPIKSIALKNKNVKLKDLLFLNPPLTKDQKRHRRSIQKSSEGKKKFHEDASESQNSSQQSSEELTLVPKVKLGPEGKLVLDESSTVINRKNLIKDQEAIIEDDDEIIPRTNYDSFRRRPAATSQTKWSSEDTQKFYHALTMLGTDFSLMESLLFSGQRSRTELHKKFKREERVNKAKVDIALANRISVNSEELDGLKDILYK